jgi:hypothetical protein
MFFTHGGRSQHRAETVCESGTVGAHKNYFGGKSMSAHDSEHAHHEPEDESIGLKVGIFFICVLVALYFIAL